jgi:hypothetical protein
VDEGNPASPWMVETLYKEWDFAHLSTGAGFRNHPPYINKKHELG